MPWARDGVKLEGFRLGIENFVLNRIEKMEQIHTKRGAILAKVDDGLTRSSFFVSVSMHPALIDAWCLT